MESNYRSAINELKAKLVMMFGGDIELKLFGSVARGEEQKYSDIDVLVLLPGEVDHNIEERVFDAAYDLELKYAVVFGIIVYEKSFWKSDLAAAMPLHRNVEREGLSL